MIFLLPTDLYRNFLDQNSKKQKEGGRRGAGVEETRCACGGGRVGCCGGEGGERTRKGYTTYHYSFPPTLPVFEISGYVCFVTVCEWFFSLPFRFLLHRISRLFGFWWVFSLGFGGLRKFYRRGNRSWSVVRRGDIV